MQGIYMIRNKLNNKLYIGRAKNIKRRWKRHKDALKDQHHNNEHLLNSWIKYGEDNFEFSVIEEVEFEKQGEREKYWILFYKSYDSKFGYNKTFGGEGEIPTLETRQKISKKVLEAINNGKIIHFALEDSQVIEIIELLKQNKSLRFISEKFNVSASTIQSIKRDESYCHINRKGYLPPPKRIKKQYEKIDFSDFEVTSILNRLEFGELQRDIAKDLNVSKRDISNIFNNKTYKHIDRKQFILNKSELNDEQVKNILHLLSIGKLQSDIAKIYNVDIRLIRKIKHNKTYRHVNREIFEIPKQGIHINNMKLKNEEVMSILEKLADGCKIKDLSDTYNVSYTTIKKIKNNLCYTHIDRNKYNIKIRKRGSKL